MIIDRIFQKMSMPVVALAALAVICGCAPKQTVKPDEGAAVPAAQEAGTTEADINESALSTGTKIVAVDVVGEDGATVLIEGDGDLPYTVIWLPDPPRAVVDIPGVSLDDISPSMEINNQYISSISASSYPSGTETIARIEIGLKPNMKHEVEDGEKSVMVTVVPSAEEDVVPVSTTGSVLKSEPEPEPDLPRVEKITKVESYAEGGVTFVSVTGNGTFAGTYKAFTLDGPPRLVVDVLSVGSDVKKKELAVKGGYVKNVRIGAHADKVRFVFDAVGKTMPAYNISEQGAALVFGFGDAAAIAALSERKSPVKTTGPEPKLEPLAKPEPELETVAEPKSAPKKPKGEVPSAVIAAETTVLEDYDEGKFNVRRVDVKKLKKRIMVNIEGTSKPEYKVRDSKDGLSLYIDFKKAYIPEDLRVTMDASELGTKLMSVSAYQHSTAPSNIVRVYIKFKEPVQYSIKETSRNLVLDFPLTVEDVVKEEEEIEAKKKYSGSKVHLNLSGAEIRDVLRLIAEVSQMNIIAADEVSGTITMRLENVPWDQAFDLILASKGLEKIQDGNIIRVVTVERARKEVEATQQAKASQEKIEDLLTEYIRISYDKASDLSGQVKELLSPRGTTTVHEGTNTLVVRDIASAIANVKDYIKRVDIPTPQVLIEARIIYAERSFTQEIGVKWNVTQQTPNPNAIPTPRITTTESVSVDATSGVGTTGQFAFALGKLIGANPLDLDITLLAAERNGTVKTISKPSVITLDNKEAKIEQGESIPFATTSAGGTETSFIDANLSLTVTPHITPDGGISMQIKASSNSIGSYRGGGGEPSINKKEASTEVLVRDGETTVIGGIVVTDSNSNSSGVPFFMHIPVIGWLFKNRLVTESQKELLIFITPTIVTNSQIN
ncbi:MAG: type IV pilus secretin PilQ [Deltaproteobacteria bacterium]|nr:type IV pilus secretin PilQ [Deltaproteobacteria bacterium]